MKPNLGLLLFIAIPFLPILFSASSAWNGRENPIIVEVNEYFKAMSRFESQTQKESLELLYHKGQAVATKLVQILELLSEADYDSAVTQMKGYLLSREEIIFVEPDISFFKDLSKTRGLEGDTSFFNFMGHLKPDNVWPAFIEQQTDYSGCTIFGKGILTGLYEEAVSFRYRYPSMYDSDIDHAIGQIKYALTSSTCACGDSSSVIKEFQSFLNMFPSADIAPQINERVLEIRERRARIRFNCISG